MYIKYILLTDTFIHRARVNKRALNKRIIIIIIIIIIDSNKLKLPSVIKRGCLRESIFWRWCTVSREEAPKLGSGPNGSVRYQSEYER